ncbi:MAG: hypothetical protein IID39_09950 [Planctomycetes bacterium]|nr:hypothetical protein [Planctomycetota bacterium]
MPAPDRDRWSEWRELAKARTEAAREDLKEWWEVCYAEPVLFWQTPAVRYTTYGLGAILLLLLLRGTFRMLEPAGGGVPQARAVTANFDVICSNPGCGRHFVIERKFRFRKFPVTCPFCSLETGHRALRCRSQTCRGKLARTVQGDDGWHCARCNQRIAPDR